MSSIAPPRPTVVAASVADARPAVDEPEAPCGPASPRLARRQHAALAALVVALDVAIVGPLLGRGVLQLVDYGAYPVGAHPPTPLSSYGFPPGITSKAPVYAVLSWLFGAVHWAPLTLLPYVAIAPLACVGFARLLPGRGLAIAGATLLFTVNPFVYERMANGQVYVVMGYALVPCLLAIALRPMRSLLATGAVGGLLTALAIALSVHYLFIDGVVLVTVVVVHAVLRQPRVVAAAAAIGAFAAVLSLYWLVPAIGAGAGREGKVSTLDLAAFHTLPDPTWGLATNVAGLYGFFRGGVPLVKDAISGWPFVLVALLVTAAFGLMALLRSRGRADRGLGVTCLVLAVAGVLLALGAEGPTGGLFTWLFVHVPAFRVMREPEKFSALIVLAYAPAFGLGIEAVARSVRTPRGRAACAGVLLAIPLLYGYTELWGFSSVGATSVVPASWATADRTMPRGAAALALPWSAYVEVPWRADRLVANPMASAFDRPVLTGDDIEAGPIVSESNDPRSAFLQFALTQGPRVKDLGRVLAPLGIREVLLAKFVGWQHFEWLDDEGGLTRTYESATLVIFRVDAAAPLAYAPRHTVTVRDWGSVLALAQRAPLIDYLVTVRHARPGPLVAPVLRTPAVAPAVLDATAGSPVAQQLELTAATRRIVLSNPDFSGWRLGGFRTASQFGVTVAFTTGRPPPTGPEVASFGPYGRVERWDAIGALLALATLVLLGVLLRRARARVAVSADPASG